ncbi:S1 family peptidase [Streptomyces marincola]|uniref:S1 family peptidase n=1 Tax=Streptomyces marincola TaxID=2878388 RepID=UPI001CF52D15|nr:S1 family peptidase [Streptomyces marincola]UCM88625.1 S1 family peptidase [Streptomyces marincola]
MRTKRTTSRTGATRRLRAAASVAGGLLAAAALFTPGVAHAASPAVAPAAAGTFSTDQLADASEAVDAANIAGTAWAVDTEANEVHVLADESVTQREIAAIEASADGLSEALRIERVPGTFETYLQGGDPIYADVGWTCSAGFNVRAGGTFYFLTAGHCTEDPYGPTPPYPLWNDGASWIGFTAGSNFPGDDFGIVQYDPQPGSVPSTVVGGGTITGFGNPVVGQSACRSGVTTGLRCGSVTGLNWSVDYGGGDIVHGMIRTNICAEPGDSGGPLWSGSTGLGLTSGGSGNCSVGGTTFFQPVAEAASYYGVTVP